jgi:hypothetical protein
MIDLIFEPVSTANNYSSRDGNMFKVLLVSASMGLVFLLAATSAAAEPAPASPSSAPLVRSNVQLLSQLPGSDWGTKLDACVTALPTNGGICDARDLGGPQQLNKVLAIRKDNVRILLGAASVQMVDGAHLDVLANNFSLVGLGKLSSIFNVGTDAGIHIGNDSIIARKWHLEGFGVLAAHGRSPMSGILLRNAREGRFQSLIVDGFASSGAAGILVGSNSWTVLLDDVNISANAVGISISGTGLNAWTIRSSIVVGNGIGILFDSQSGTGQGVAITDGTHFEGNRIAGIFLRSGDFQEISISSTYVEAYEKQSFVLMRGGGKALIRVRSFNFIGGHIYTHDRPPFEFDATVGAEDTITATLEQVYYRTSSPGTPAAVFRGKRALGMVIGPIVVDGAERYTPSETAVSNTDGGGAVTVGISRSSGVPSLEVTPALTIGLPSAGGSAITGHYSGDKTVQFARWQGVDCQDRDVSVGGAREGDSISLGISPSLASQAGIVVSAFVSSRGIVTIRACKITTGPSTAAIEASLIRLDVWRH